MKDDEILPSSHLPGAGFGLVYGGSRSALASQAALLGAWKQSTNVGSLVS